MGIYIPFMGIGKEKKDDNFPMPFALFRQFWSVSEFELLLSLVFFLGLGLRSKFYSCPSISLLPLIPANLAGATGRVWGGFCSGLHPFRGVSC